MSSAQGCEGDITTETIRAAALNSYPELAREIGLDPLRMLDAAGISRAALSDPDMLISAPALRDLWELCGRNAEDWGLRLMERRGLSVMGPVLLVVRDQPTVRLALAALQRFNAIHHQATSLQLDEVDDLAIARVLVRYEIPGPSRQVAEASLYQLLRFLRLFLGPGWRPLSATFTHGPPASLDTHRRIFGRDILFDQDSHSLVFRRSELEARNETGDPEMLRLIEGYATGLVSRAEADVRARALQAVLDLLPAGSCTIQAVADRLGMGPRRLQRQLALVHKTFKDLVDEARLTLVVQYLEESDRPLAEVAELLGFSALSAFSRWHREHCGQSPSLRRATRLRGVPQKH